MLKVEELLTRLKMAEKKNKNRADLRFEREAKALQKNLEKRKLQQKKREELKRADKEQNQSK